MNQLLVVFCAVLVIQQLYMVDGAAVKQRHKRAAYELPDGVQFYVGEIRTTFKCPGDGYYGDMDNDCKLFHICVTHNMPNGDQSRQHFTFACGNQTVFNQFSLTCAYEDESIPCENTKDFFYLNDLLYAGPETALHSDQDVERAALYGTRLSARSSSRQSLSNSRETESSEEEQSKKK